MRRTKFLYNTIFFQTLLSLTFIFQFSGCSNEPKEEEEKYIRPIIDPIPDSVIIADTSAYKSVLTPTESPVNVIPEQDPNGVFWGLRDTSSGKLILDYIYQTIWDFKEGYAVVMLNDKFGIINKTGKQIIEPGYESIKSEMNCGYAVMENYSLRVLDTAGISLLPQLSGNISQVSTCQQRIIMKENLAGMVNFKGEEILPFVFTNAYFVSDRFLVAEKADKNDNHRMFGLYDMNGKKVLPHVYQYFDRFYEGRSIAKRNDKYCIIGENGTEIRSTEYSRINRYYNGYAVVYKPVGKDDIRVGIIDRSGREVVPPIYQWLDNVYNMFDGMVPVAKDFKYGFADSTGKVAIPFVYVKVEAFENGIAKIWKDWHHVGYIDKKGKEVIPAIFEPEDYRNLRRYFGKYIIGLKDSIYHVYDFKGNKVTELNYQDLNPSDENHFAFIARKNNRYGLLDSNFKIKLPFEYESLEFLPNELAAWKQGKLGFIDKNGKVLIPFKYDRWETYKLGYTDDYKNGLILLSNGTKTGLLNAAKKIVIPVIYEEIGNFNNGLSLVKRNGKYGFVNVKGKEVIRAIYDTAKPFDGGASEVSLNEETFLIDKNGKRVEEEY